MGMVLGVYNLGWKYGNLHQDTPSILIISGSYVHLSLIICTHDMPNLFITGPPCLFALTCHVNSIFDHFRVIILIFQKQKKSKSNDMKLIFFDHPRDHPGRYFYYVGTFWLYLQSHCRLRNVTLACVLCAYNGHLTMALVWPRWRKRKSGPPCEW
jgi:hypothetical protein